MLHAYLGPEAFQKGLQSYLKKHAYGNTETADLWAAWTEASDKPVAETMKSWTQENGIPLNPNPHPHPHPPPHPNHRRWDSPW